MSDRISILFKIMANYCFFIEGIISEKEMKENSEKLKKELEKTISLA